MKICVAQTKPVSGDIRMNINHHKVFISLAAANGAQSIFFPELSLTGYEPALAKDLAVTIADERLQVFQSMSNDLNIVIGVGVPTKQPDGTCISMVIFQPHQSSLTYSKKWLHRDELDFFISGENIPVLPGFKPALAIAICYELSIPEHAITAHENGASIYIASVAKTAAGVEKAIEQLRDIAEKYSMTVLLSNCVGECDGEQGGGKTTVWAKEGIVLGQLNTSNEGIIIVDIGTGAIIKKIL